MSGPFEWQEVSVGTGERTERMKVQGGWLYRTSVLSTTKAIAVALLFVPYNDRYGDPNT